MTYPPLARYAHLIRIQIQHWHIYRVAISRLEGSFKGGDWRRFSTGWNKVREV